MGKALVENVLVNLAPKHHGFAATICTFLTACYSALGTAKFLLGFRIKARILNLGVV
jgi:hypothetical protein